VVIAVALCVVLAWPGCGDDNIGGGQVELGDLVTACIAASSCGVQKYPRVSDCASGYYLLHRRFGLGPVYDSIYRCINQAKGDCDSVYECFGVSRMAGSCGSTFEGACEGSKAVSCNLVSNRVTILDCSQASLQCAPHTGSGSFEASCGFGKCTTAYAPKCKGNMMLQCEDGVVTPDDCATQGEVCGTDSQGLVKCVGNTKDTCMTQGPSAYRSKCVGRWAYSCVNGYIKKFNCGAGKINTSCKDGACASTGTQCSDALDTCEGTNIKACLDGIWKTYDCAKLGFGVCYKQTYGAICSPIS
jgi:hypothetical protein